MDPINCNKKSTLHTEIFKSIILFIEPEWLLSEVFPCSLRVLFLVLPQERLSLSCSRSGADPLVCRLDSGTPVSLYDGLYAGL